MKYSRVLMNKKYILWQRASLKKGSDNYAYGNLFKRR